MSRKLVLLKDLIKEITMGPFGSDIKVDNFINYGVPVLNGSNVMGVKLSEESFKYISKEKAVSLKKANTKRGDVVITHRGTLGQISYIPENSKYENYIISQSQFRVTLKKDLVDPIYFTYYFHSSEGQKRLLSFKSHVGVPALAQATTNFKLLEFPIEPLEKQLKISKVLTDLDAKIELNNKINTELEAMAKLIYDYWFVQFDFPDKNGKPYKSTGGKMVYNKELKREIPDGWEVHQLSSLLKHNYSSITNGNSFDKLVYLDTSSLTLNIIDSTQVITSKTDNVPSRAKRIINANDILYSTVRPNLCHYGIIKHPKNNMIASTGFIQLASKVDGVNSDLIYTFLTSDWVTQRLHQIASLAVSAYPSISPNDILDLKIALPKDRKKINNINTTFDNTYKLISNRQVENEKLAKLRDWLLPMLMNGQVKVK